jgi:threonyl-tRNA synthetase
LALLIEKYAGAFPTWLAPVQVKVLAMTDRTHDASVDIANKLQALGIRVETDLRSEKLGYKIREAQMQKIPYMLIVGDKEVENSVVAVRSRKDGDLGTMPLQEFIERIQNEIVNKLR